MSIFSIFFCTTHFFHAPNHHHTTTPTLLPYGLWSGGPGPTAPCGSLTSRRGSTPGPGWRPPLLPHTPGDRSAFPYHCLFFSLDGYHSMAPAVVVSRRILFLTPHATVCFFFEANERSECEIISYPHLSRLRRISDSTHEWQNAIKGETNKLIRNFTSLISSCIKHSFGTVVYSYDSHPFVIRHHPPPLRRWRMGPGWRGRRGGGGRKTRPNPLTPAPSPAAAVAAAGAAGVRVHRWR